MKILAIIRYILFIVAFMALMLLYSTGSLAEYEKLKDYPKPLVCKKIIKVDGTYMYGDPIILTWAQLENINKNRMIFKYKGKLVEIGPGDDYTCTLAGN